MGSKKIIMLVGSILIGALAGFALLNYVQGVQEDVENRVARVPVFVLVDDVAAGTTASSVQATNRIVQREIESSFKPLSAVTDLSQIAGRVAVSNIAANQVLVTGMFEDPEVVETTYADLLPEGRVAFSMTIDKANAVNGFLDPGDFVDMIVLGEPPETPGEQDAFEESAATSPYTQPARYLYRGVRIVSINNDVVGQAKPVATEGAPVAEEEDPAAGAQLQITLAVPPDAAQRILSVDPSSIVLSLLPADWEPAAQANIVIDDILIEADLPGEDPTQITPDGPEGFIDDLADAAAADDTDTLDTAGSDDAATSGLSGATDDAGAEGEDATDGADE